MHSSEDIKKDLIARLRKYYDTPKAGVKLASFFKRTEAENVHHEACGRVIAALRELPDDKIAAMVGAFRQYLAAQKSKLESPEFYEQFITSLFRSHSVILAVVMEADGWHPVQ
jgi:hypothetical protein